MKTNSEILATFNCPETLTDAVKEPVKRWVKAETRSCDNCKRDGETCTYQEIPKAKVCGNWITKLLPHNQEEEMTDYSKTEQAFPAGNPTHGGNTGMTLRDYFAGQALVGLLSNPTNDPLKPLEYASDAYNIADAMMEARKR